MTKKYCRLCGNELFFKKIIEGHIAIPLEVGDDGDDEFEVYNNKDIEFREIYHSYLECGEGGNTNVEEELEDEDEQI